MADETAGTEETKSTETKIEVVQIEKGSFDALVKSQLDNKKYMEENRGKMDTSSEQMVELEKRMKDFDDTLRAFREGQAQSKLLGNVEHKFETPEEAILCDRPDEVLKTWQEKSDMVYLGMLLEKTPSLKWLSDAVPGDHGNKFSNTRLVKSFQTETKAMFGGSGNVGADYIPTILSASLFEEVRLSLKVGALHTHFPMTSSLVNIPARSGAVFSELIPESTSDSSDKITAKTLTTRKVQFSAKKLALRILTSTELDEDAIIPTLQNIRSEIVYALSTGEEYAIINGDTAGTMDITDQNGDAIHSKSNLKAFDGYRRIARDIDGVVISAGGSLTASHVRSLFASMGKFAVDVSRLAWVTGTQGYFKGFLSLGDVQTLDKLGPQAVILNGQLGQYYGVPILVSEWVRKDVGASGFSGGSGSLAKSSIILVNKDAFQVGDKRSVSLESEKDIDTDQIKIVGTRRLDFNNMYSTASDNTVVGEIKDLG